MRLKAFAKVAYDKLTGADDGGADGLNVLHPLLVALAGTGEVSRKTDSPAACVQQYDAFIDKFSIKDLKAIGKTIFTKLDDRMNGPAGILTVSMVTLIGARKNTKNKLIYPDGAVLGLASSKAFRDFGVSVFEALRVARKMRRAVNFKAGKSLSDTLAKAKANTFVFDRKTFDYLFKGACLDTRLALKNGYSMGCPRYTKRGAQFCHLKTGCQWSGAWNGNEEAEDTTDDFVQPLH
jgi:hypothetical protein